MSTRTQYRKLDYREKRKDRRVLFPPLSIAIGGASFETVNWSFGGFLVEGCHHEFDFGEAVTGTFGWEGTHHAFAGRVSRFGGEARELAVSFSEVSDAALLFLDRRLSEYLNEKKR